MKKQIKLDWNASYAEYDDGAMDSCDNETSSSYHRGCHPALFMVIMSDGSRVVRCYDCLDPKTTQAEADKDSEQYYND